MSEVMTLLALGMFLATIVERVSEWFFVPVLEWIVVGIVKWRLKTSEFVWEGPSKLLLVSIVNFMFYLALLRYDYVTSIMLLLGIPITPMQGLVLSALFAAGGSNFVHTVFAYVDARKREVKLNVAKRTIDMATGVIDYRYTKS